MPAGPFIGAGLGQMFAGATQGMAQGSMQRMLMDRQDQQRQDALQLRRDQMQQQSEQHRQAGAKGFVEGAVNFYKLTGDPNATLKFWNENAPQYGLGMLESISPISPEESQLTYVEDSGQKIPMVFNKKTGQIKPVTLGNTGQPYMPNPSMKQQADEMSGQTRLDMMTGAEVDPNVAAAAGVKLPKGEKPEYTPKEAYQRLTKLSQIEATAESTSGVSDEAIKEFPILAAFAKKVMTPEVKANLLKHIQAERDYITPFISGSGAQQGGAGAQQNPLQGKQPGRYKINGQVVKWDGQKVVQ